MSTVPNTVCHWLDRQSKALISVGFDINVGKVDGMKEEFGADRKGDKLATLIDGLTKSADATLAGQLKGRKLIVSVGKSAKSTILTALPSDNLLNYTLPQFLEDAVKQTVAKAPPKAAANPFASAFGAISLNSTAAAPPSNSTGLTEAQEDRKIAFAGKEIFKKLAGYLTPISEKGGKAEDEQLMMFKVTDKLSPTEVATSIFRAGEIPGEDGTLFITYGILKTLVNK